MDKVNIGFIPLTDSAPLVVAKELGFFEQQGLDVTLHREVSWANIRDKLVVGAFDAAHMLAPMLMATTLGVSGVKKALVTGYSFGLNGNAVSVSTALYEAMSLYEKALVLKPELSAGVLKQVIADRKSAGLVLLRFAVVFPYSMHHYLLRHWLAEVGLEAQVDYEIVVIPPSDVVQALEEGLIDGCCVGEPWNTHAVKQKVGVTLITGCEIWPDAPEKVLGVTQLWAAQNREVHQRLIWALYQASAWIDDSENHAQLVTYLADVRYIGAPEESIRNALNGQVCNPLCTTCRSIPDFAIPFKSCANFPRISHAQWILEQMQRWHQVDGSLEIAQVAHQIYLADEYRAVLSHHGVASYPEASWI